ncbi:MAG: hypothetical protein CM15mP25_3910 [Gammaproteobacteria bacterium]|nr:MAG: hypothetical protein CM15mP25_3910 [Gammaproteobacteria bacterium]
MKSLSNCRFPKALHYHFANKEALLTQCFDYTLDQLEQAVARIEQLEAPLRQSSRQPVGISSYCKILIRPAGALQRHHRPATRGASAPARTIASVHATLENYLAQAAEARQFRDIPPGIVIQLLTGALNASMDLDAWQPMMISTRVRVITLPSFSPGSPAQKPRSKDFP